MMDTHRMAALLEAAGPASIRTLGDPEQAQPVGAGGWHQLVDQAIGGHAQLTTVIRQHNPADREVCAAIRDGHAPRRWPTCRAAVGSTSPRTGRPRSRSWCMPGTTTVASAAWRGWRS